MMDLKVRFPKYFNRPNESFDLARDRLLYRIKEIKGADIGDKITDIDEQFLNLMKPKVYNWHNRENEELKFETSFENMCHSLRESSPNKDVKDMTVTEVYTLIEFVNKKVERLKQR